MTEQDGRREGVEDPSVPWRDLSETEKGEFVNMLRRAGLDLDSRAEAEKYYGNMHRADAELRRQNQPLPEEVHNEHYGVLAVDPETELFGVGEFGPGVAGAGTPVFEARTANDSFLTFCFPPSAVADEYLRVFHAVAYEAGEFSFLMDRVFERFGPDDPDPREVVFTNVVTEFLRGEDLDVKLDGFAWREVEIPDGEPHAGEDVRELVGEWNPGRES
jgi:hypothetical protein